MKKIRIGLLAVAMLASGAARAAGAADDSAKAQYEAERARCMSGAAGQDQASCLRSAGAAYQAIKDHRLSNPSSDYRTNALARCSALPAGDRADCEARVAAGTSRDSVKGGGDLKETVTTGIPASPSTR